jgi:hypothetical protein
MPRRAVGGSFCRKNRANSKLPASGPVRLFHAKSEVSLTELIKEKLHSLKQNRSKKHAPPARMMTKHTSPFSMLYSVQITLNNRYWDTSDEC